MNMPKLRFSEFSDEWEEKTVGKLGKFVGGGTPSKKIKEYWNGQIPWVSSSDIPEDGINEISYSRFITQKAVSESATKIVPANSILAVSRVGVGKLAVNDRDVCTSQDFTNIVPVSTNPKFLAYLLKSKKSNLLAFNQGTSIKGFTVNDLATLRVFVPIEAEQEKISGFLSAVDDKISSLEKKIELLEKYKKSTMQKIFTQQIRFGDFPEEWQTEKLGSVSRIRKGQQINGDQLDRNGAYPMLNGGITPSGHTDKYNSLENTVTISEGGNSCGYVNLMRERFWSGGHLYTLVDLKINKYFLYHYLKYLQKRIMRLRVGSGLPNIQKADLERLLISTPSPEEQQKIANFLTNLDDKIDLTERELERVRLFKEALLQQMFV